MLSSCSVKNFGFGVFEHEAFEAETEKFVIRTETKSLVLPATRGSFNGGSEFNLCVCGWGPFGEGCWHARHHMQTLQGTTQGWMWKS